MDNFKNELERVEQVKDSVYSERNRLAIAFVKLAVKSGMVAGRGYDKSREVHDEWRNVVYVELSDGHQVSWHIAPSEVYLLEGLPEFPKEWDGTFLGKEPNWVNRI